MLAPQNNENDDTTSYYDIQPFLFQRNIVTMYKSKKGHTKSVLNIQLKFDKGREADFKMILNEKFAVKAKANDLECSIDEQAILDKDFHAREEELQLFRESSQSAMYAPLLTQAMVKKARLYTESLQVYHVLSLRITVTRFFYKKCVYKKVVLYCPEC